jgi:hypothetical protein
MFPSPVFGLKNVFGCFGLPGDFCDDVVVLLEAVLEDLLPSILPLVRCFLFKVFAVDDGLAAVK